MRNIKNAIRKTLAVLGWECRRSSNSPERSSNSSVRYENFLNLVKAYEQKLNDDDTLIFDNELRPKLLARLLGTPPTEAYFIVQALSKCKDISGDVCEFGVAQGETSALIANEITQFDNKRLHLFDSFEGLPKPSDKDQLKDDIFSLGNIEAYTGTMSCPEDMVRTRLTAIAFPSTRYVIHKGFIEKTINDNKAMPKEVCFAYVDFDFYEPIKIALHFLHNVSPSGAIFIVDDYDFFSTGAKTAVDEFIDTHAGEYELFVPNTVYGHFAVLTKKG